MKINVKNFISLLTPKSKRIVPQKDTYVEVDIEPGNLFTWYEERRPAISLKIIPPDNKLPVLIHDGYFVAMPRPQRWWYLWAWIPVAKALWRMPFDKRERI